VGVGNAIGGGSGAPSPTREHIQRGGRARARGRRTHEWSDDSDTSYSHDNDEMGESECDDDDIQNPLSVKHLYRSSTWGKTHIEYNPKPKEFSGTSHLKKDFPRFPTFLKLFVLFWPDGPVLLRIVRETNRYTTTLNEHGISPGGATWELLTIAGLKAFLACTMLLGLKKQPNRKTYWARVGSFFHCPLISSIFTRARF
jgi:hypothetical protein